jgi:hypothetical protein
LPLCAELAIGIIKVATRAAKLNIVNTRRFIIFSPIKFACSRLKG